MQTLGSLEHKLVPGSQGISKSSPQEQGQSEQPLVGGGVGWQGTGNDEGGNNGRNIKN